ncbi:MAG: ATP-binding cassette domain-containing protein [Rhodospirillaceae bacterium]|nr:ATP-binding cassette domain-containing protein [Rhodospirillaceae bacterium]
MIEAPAKIRLRDVHKRFGAKVVLDGIDLDVSAGESLVVIGGSGSGKSVLIKSIQGILRPESGSIQVDGEEVVGMGGRQLERINAKIGMLFQGAALFDSLPVWENVAFGALQGKAIDRSAAYELAVNTLAKVGLSADVADLWPAELSGGMQKRVGLARAVATEPEIIFFDEPTTGLDPIMADVINDLIVTCVKRLGATAVTITHDMASVRKIADRVAMLYRGKLIWVGPISEIDTSGNPYVEQFINGRAEGPISMDLRR